MTEKGEELAECDNVLSLTSIVVLWSAPRGIWRVATMTNIGLILIWIWIWILWWNRYNRNRLRSSEVRGDDEPLVKPLNEWLHHSKYTTTTHTNKCELVSKTEWVKQCQRRREVILNLPTPDVFVRVFFFAIGKPMATVLEQRSTNPSQPVLFWLLRQNSTSWFLFIF